MEYFKTHDNIYLHFFSIHGFCGNYDYTFLESICNAPGLTPLIPIVETIYPENICFNYNLQKRDGADIIYECIGQHIQPIQEISNDLYTTLSNLYSSSDDREIHVYCLFCRGSNVEPRENYDFGGGVEIIDVDNLMQMEMIGGRSKKKTKKRKIKKSKHLKIKKSKTHNKIKNNKK
jgi:hypothetical protein